MNRDAFIGFIDAFINEYAQQITPDIYLKLFVLKEFLNKESSKKIKEKLVSIISYDNEIQKKNNKKNVYPNLVNSKKWEESIAAYLHKDNNKISRITSKYIEICTLPKLIQINKLVKMILCKYPRPSLIGFPFNDWTPSRLKKYIHFRFNITKQSDKISINTIEYVLYNLNYKIPSLLKYDEGENCEYYYIYLKEEHYPVSKKDKNNQKGRRYNRTLFAFAFNLHEIADSYKHRHYISYVNLIEWRNSSCYKKGCSKKNCYTQECHYKLPYNKTDKKKAMYHVLHQLFSKMYCHSTNGDKKKKPLFFIADEKPFSLALTVRNYRTLSELPKYSYVLVPFSNSCKSSIITDNDVLKYITSKECYSTLMQIRKLEPVLKKKNLTSRDSIREFLNEIRAVLEAG